MFRRTFTALMSVFCLAILGGSAPSAADPESSGRFEAAFSSFTGRVSLAGGWKIVSTSEGDFGELGEGFRARSAPDLKLFLSPRAHGEIIGSNASEGALRMGLLKANRGVQRYPIPEGTDSSAFQSLVVHCEQYAKLWGTSPLR